MAKINNYEELVRRVNKIKKIEAVDLSVDEDLSIAIMNLISLEEHFFFTAEKTGKGEYFELLSEIREMRKNLLGAMIKQYEGEVWCISKHLLAASMRLMEVGTKLQSRGQLDRAKEIFGQSYELFNLFFAVRLKMADIPNIKNGDDRKIYLDKPWTKEDIMNQLVDCCKE